MEADGACQFRALAYQLLGEQSHHAVVRQVVIAHMRRHEAFFCIYFEAAGEFEVYLRKMAKPTTWGDELTLRAAAEAFGCVAHVITSEAANWYLVYKSEEGDDSADVEAILPRARLAPPPRGKDVMLAYVSPIHYNAVAVAAAPD